MQTTTTHDVVGRRPVCVPTSDPCCDMLSHPRNHSSQLGPWYWRGAGSSCQQQVQATDWHVTKLRNPAMRSFVYSVLKCVGVCLRLCGEPQQLSKKIEVFTNSVVPHSYASTKGGLEYKYMSQCPRRLVHRLCTPTEHQDCVRARVVTRSKLTTITPTAACRIWSGQRSIGAIGLQVHPLMDPIGWRQVP